MQNSQAGKVISSDPAISVFPNPTTGKFTVSFISENESKYTLKVFDILGETIIQKTIQSIEGINSREVDLSDSPKGIYLLMMYRDGEALKGVKIIVE